MRTLHVIIYLSFSINSIGQQELPDKHFTGVLKDTDIHGKLLKETIYKSGKKNGVEKEYFENGKLKKLTTYAHGKKNGIAEEFGGFGAKLESVKTYKNDNLNGLSKEYYTHWFWQPTCTNPYAKIVSDKDDRMEGKPKDGSEDYYVDSIKKEVYYKNGKLNGPVKGYYNSGKLKSEGTYSNGKLNGISEVYYENGNLQSQRYYKNGRLLEVPIEYDSKGVAINSVSQTKSIFYNEKGQLIADTNYKISKGQMDKFIPVESYLLKYLNSHLDYPEQAKDMKDAGYVIISFKIGTTDTLQQIRVEKDFEKKNYLSKEALRKFKDIRLPKSAYSKHLSQRKYFLAVRFELDKFFRCPGFIEVKTYYINLVDPGRME